MNNDSDKTLSASTLRSYRRNITHFVLWIFLNNHSPDCLTEDTKESLQLAQEAEKRQKNVRPKTRSKYSAALRECFAEQLDLCMENSKTIIYLEGPKRITLELIKGFVEAKQLGPKATTQWYWRLTSAMRWLHGQQGLDWDKSDLSREISDFLRINGKRKVSPSVEEIGKILERKKRKWAPVSKPLDEAARKHKIYNQIDRSYAVECVAASHGPNHAPYIDHFTQSSFHLRDIIPPKPSLLDFIAKCTSMKLGVSQKRNPESSSIYQRMEQTMDETALVALGTMTEECMVASMLPLAKAYVGVCREKDIALQNSQKNCSATDDPQNDEESYNLNSFAHWTRPCEEAIVEMASRINEQFSHIPFLPSTQPANLRAKDPSTLSFPVPSISKILGRSFKLEECLLEEATKKEWFAKQSAKNVIDEELCRLFFKTRRSEEFVSHQKQVDSAPEEMERNDSRLPLDSNFIDCSEPSLNVNVVEV